MKLFMDLHIHTGLSPCASENMTPNNIINMSILKELDIIAITDHNSSENCKVCMELGEKVGLIVIPGMELQTKEEVHFLCLFSQLKDLLEFQKIVYANLPKIKNDSRYFGKQYIYNEKDEIIGKNERLLINSVNMSCDEAYEYVEKLKGVIIPAHVDKTSFSIISNLGFIPPNMKISTLEISKKCHKENFLEKYNYLRDYKFIKNSDAHFLGDILERENSIYVNDKNMKEILDQLKTKKAVYDQ